MSGRARVGRHGGRLSGVSCDGPESTRCDEMCERQVESDTREKKGSRREEEVYVHIGTTLVQVCWKNPVWHSIGHGYSVRKVFG